MDRRLADPEPIGVAFAIKCRVLAQGSPGHQKSWGTVLLKGVIRNGKAGSALGHNARE